MGRSYNTVAFSKHWRITFRSMLRLFLLFLCLFTGKSRANNFVLDSIDLTDVVFEQCTTCDARSDRAGNRAVAGALREYMTRNHVQILLEKDEVKVRESLPDEAINTGHSCSKTATAMNVVGQASMIPGTARLGPEGVVYDDLLKMSFAATDIDHEVRIDMSIRVRFGVKIFGSCKRVGRKTCDGVSGSARGTNHVSVVMAASNILAECIADQEHLTFNLDVDVTNTAEDKTYSEVTANDKKCNFLFGIGKIKATEYANRYLKSNKKIRELRGQKLVNELERKLGASLGATVTIPITTNGSPRPCPPNGRDLEERAKRCNKQKTCPDGFTRIGNTDRCSKYFGVSRPNCSTYGQNATLYSRRFGRMTVYWCFVPMV